MSAADLEPVADAGDRMDEDAVEAASPAPAKVSVDVNAATDAFYLRYYAGHQGRFGHEFLAPRYLSLFHANEEFDVRIQGDGKAAVLRYSNDSKYRNDSLIRKEVTVSPAVVAELKRLIEDSEVLSEDDSKWPTKNRDGKQELEIRLRKYHISFETCKLGSLNDVQKSDDPEGLRVFYYFIQNLKAFVFSLISLHFKIKPV